MVNENLGEMLLSAKDTARLALEKKTKLGVLLKRKNAKRNLKQEKSRIAGARLYTDESIVLRI